MNAPTHLGPEPPRALTGVGDFWIGADHYRLYLAADGDRGRLDRVHSGRGRVVATVDALGSTSRIDFPTTWPASRCRTAVAAIGRLWVDELERRRKARAATAAVGGSGGRS